MDNEDITNILLIASNPSFISIYRLMRAEVSKAQSELLQAPVTLEPTKIAALHNRAQSFTSFYERICSAIDEISESAQNNKAERSLTPREIIEKQVLN